MPSPIINPGNEQFHLASPALMYVLRNDVWQAADDAMQVTGVVDIDRVGITGVVEVSPTGTVTMTGDVAIINEVGVQVLNSITANPTGAITITGDVRLINEVSANITNTPTILIDEHQSIHLTGENVITQSFTVKEQIREI